MWVENTFILRRQKDSYSRARLVLEVRQVWPAQTVACPISLWCPQEQLRRSRPVSSPPAYCWDLPAAMVRDAGTPGPPQSQRTVSRQKNTI
jgi:hypothetical protein